jgi:hypothetical protein
MIKKFLLILFLLLGTLLARGQERIQLTWNASTDNVGVAGYRVWVDGDPVGTTADTFYIMDLEPGNFDLTVSAFDAAGNESGQSYPLNVSIKDILPPSIPGNLRIDFLESTSLELQWNDSYDNYKMGGYNVYVDGDLFRFTSGNRLDMELLTPDTNYQYNVSAVDAAGNESPLSYDLFAMTNPVRKDSLEMKVYPNPSYGLFRVLLSGGSIVNNTKVQVINSSGQIVYERILSYGLTPPHEEEFDLTDILVSGAYYVTLIVNNKRVAYAGLIVSEPRTFQL